MIYARVSPVMVLKLIRDGTSDRHSLFREIRMFHPGWSPAAVVQMMTRIIYGLKRAGLVKENRGGSLTITNNATQVVNALNLSLTQLAEWRPGSLLAEPLFGFPVSRPDLTCDVFVLMPFADDLFPVYENHIKQVCTDLRLSVARADDFFAAEAVVNDIWSAINACRIVIADCTRRNPNVFYEIGLAHTVGKSTILVSQTLDDIPFDLRHIRCIRYDHTRTGMKLFQLSLRKALKVELAKRSAHRPLPFRNDRSTGGARRAEGQRRRKAR